MHQRQKYVAILAMIGSAACWGGATVMSRDLLDMIEPIQLLFFQLLSSVVFLSFISFRKLRLEYFSLSLFKASLAGVLEPALAYSIGLVGLSRTSAGHASIISSSEPIFIVVLSFLFIRNRISLKVFLCVLLASIGLFFVSFSDGVGEWSIEGDALIVVATIFAALYVVFSSRWAAGFPVTLLALVQQVVGFFVVCFLILFYSEFKGPESLSIGMVAYVFVSGVVQYSLAFLFYLYGLRYISADVAALWLTLIPVFGVFGAYFFLSEVPTISMIFGMVLIGIAVVIGGRE